MKNKYLILITPMFFLLFNTNIKAQIILVPEIEQEQDQWCWAGVTKCILDYYGFNYEQCDIAEYARTMNPSQFGQTNCCTSPFSCNNWNWNWGANGSMEDILSNFGNIITNNIGNTISQAEWQIEVANGRPFIIRYGWNSGGGHFVVGYGANNTDYYTMDPWFNEGYTISTYNWLITAGGDGSWTHTQKLMNPNNIIYGCSDLLACNYNEETTVDNGSCEYIDGICETCENGIIIDNDADNDGICDDDEIETYNCINTACIDPGDNTGAYTSIDGCEAICSIVEDTWDCIDNSCIGVNDGTGLFSTLEGCQEFCHTSSITNLNKFNKKLRKITNLLGQETPIRKNYPMFYIYDDGTVEKKIIIE